MTKRAMEERVVEEARGTSTPLKISPLAISMAAAAASALIVLAALIAMLAYVTLA